MQSNISVIVVTYNGIKWINKCLESINKACRHLKYKVYVVDNGSTDETKRLILEKYPNIKLIELENNLGFGKANNIGLMKSLEDDVDYTFLCNQDAWLANNAIEELTRIANEKPEYGILSPIHYQDDSKKDIDSGFLNFMYTYCGKAIIQDSLSGKGFKDIYETEFTNAAGWLISRECVEKVGGFDPAFNHYGEDNNYCDRARYHGFKIGIVPSASMVHDRSERGVVETTLKIKPLDERIVQVRYMNPSNDLMHLYRKDRKALYKKFVSSLLRFRYRSAYKCLQKYSTLHRIKGMAQNSLKITCKEGSSFLS